LWQTAFYTKVFRRLQSAGLPFAIGGDKRATQIVTAVMDKVGFDAVDAGPLSESRRHQPGTPAFAGSDTSNSRSWIAALRFGFAALRAA